MLSAALARKSRVGIKSHDRRSQSLEKREGKKEEHRASQLVVLSARDQEAKKKKKRERTLKSSAAMAQVYFGTAKTLAWGDE